MKRFFLILLGMFMSATMLTGCGYNEIQTLDESTKAAWSEVLNQYQRRNDLIPNVVNSVKGEADFEKSTLTQVINARAKATSIQATPELMENPEAFQKFTQAQGELSSALSRLLVTVERYPDLKANKAFQDSLKAVKTASRLHATATLNPFSSTTRTSVNSRRWSGFGSSDTNLKLSTR